MRAKSHLLVVGVCLLLAGITWLVFGQTVRYPFIDFDDPMYVVQEPEINSGLTLHGITWAFTHLPSTNWYPLTNISHMAEAQFYGMNAGGYHLTNVLLHTISAILLFLVLRQMTGRLWSSAFVAAIFAIHPLRVESVAWVVERKDVLSGVFFMLTLMAYARYARNPSLGRYLTMSILFACGLMSKQMLVTVPFVLFLLDYWPLKRMRKEEGGGRNLILEKVPLFILSAAASVVAFFTQTRGTGSLEQLSFMSRLGNAIVSYVIYIWQMIWPARLAVFYPHPGNQLPFWEIALALLFLIAITAGAFALRKKYPYVGVGWLWSLSMLFPVIGLIQINRQAHADRYTYLPHIGLYLLATWAIADVSMRWRYRPQILGAAAAVAIAALIWTSRIQVTHWRDTESLWRHAIAVTRDNDTAHANLADLLLRKQRVDEAISHSQEALRIRADNADAHNNLALALLMTGNQSEGVAHLEESLRIQPANLNARVNLAWILATSADPSVRNGARAIELAESVARGAGHSNPTVLRTLAAAYAETGRFSEAIVVAEKALEIANATGNSGLAADLENNIESYRLNQPLRGR
jgi:tetratricopeptide (TPR) repeat protein